MYGIRKHPRCYNLWQIIVHPGEPITRKDTVIPNLESVLDDFLEEEVKTNKYSSMEDGWKDITISIPVEFFQIIEDLDNNCPILETTIVISWYDSNRGNYDECVYEKGMKYPLYD